jgi:dTDP-4-dehydrorhamnose reductase
MKKKILVLGGTGKLGKSVINLCQNKNYQYLSPKRQELDLSNFELLEAYLDAHRPDYLINCSSIASLEYCEKNCNASRKINYDLVKFLVDYNRKEIFKLITFSTDYVFDGLKNVKNSYLESDFKSPLSIYGLHKYMADDYVENNEKNFFTLRFSSLYGADIDNLTRKTLLNCLAKQHQKEIFKIVSDEFITPTLDLDIITVIEYILDNNSQMDFGTYHVASCKSTSRFDFNRNLANSFYTYLRKKNISFEDNYSLQFKKCSRSEFNFFNLRPINASLNVSKIKLCLPDFERRRKINELSFFDTLINKMQIYRSIDI